MNCRIKLGMFDRWYIFHPSEDSFAWTGSRWAMTVDGFPAGGVQICNFATLEEAEEYVQCWGQVNTGEKPRS